MIILGLNVYHGNASAALLIDGQLVAAVEEERFTRVKYAAGFPAHAIRYCMEEAGVEPGDLDRIVVARDPTARLVTKVVHAVRMPRFTLRRIKALRETIKVKEQVAAALDVGPKALDASMDRVEHHRAHMASTFFVSPYERAAVLSADGLGDFGSAAWGVGMGGTLKILDSVAFPHSLGLLYTAITQYLGFERYGDEYKVMGLAAFGEPRFAQEFKKLVQHQGGLRFKLNLPYFVHHKKGADMTWERSDETPRLSRLYSDRMVDLLGPARRSGEEINTRHKDIAASLQQRLEEVGLGIIRALHQKTGGDKLCLAGGVAFNCVLNGRIQEETPFEKVYVQPAAGDAGLSLGAAFAVNHSNGEESRRFEMEHAYWGPEYDESEYISALRGRQLEFSRLEDAEIIERSVNRLASGEVGGWFQGRLEWGPRALGNRSIIADPRKEEMREVINNKIKYREPFRPFAPSVLEERVGEYFDRGSKAPFMARTYKVKPEKLSQLGATTHVDDTARLQTVDRSTNPRYWALIRAFEEETGVPALLNTSFNENEPIVNTPEEAVDCYLRTDMDFLVMGNLFTAKGEATG